MKRTACWLLLFFINISIAMINSNEYQNFIDMPYGKIWYAKWLIESTSHKTPLIFIHGGPGYESGYIMNLKNLAITRPCIFYDQSGCGRSTMCLDTVDWTLEHYCNELSMVIDTIGSEKIILYGYSWGAALAVNYAAKNPARVEKLILASPYISTPHLLENYKKLAQSKNIYDIMVYHEKMGDTDNQEYQNACTVFFKNFIFRQDPSLFDSFNFNKEIMNIMWGVHEMSADGNLKYMNLIPLLSNLSMPVLLTAGRFDTMTPDYMKLLHSRIANSRLVFFEDSAHMPHREEEKEYISVLTNFLEDVPY